MARARWGAAVPIIQDILREHRIADRRRATCMEWIDELVDHARVRSLDELQQCLRWAIRYFRNRGAEVAYARHISGGMDYWRQSRAALYRPRRSEP